MVDATRVGAVAVWIALSASGCLLDRAGRLVTDAEPQGPSDAQGATDAGHFAPDAQPADAGRGFDGGSAPDAATPPSCEEGWVDADSDPSNGCECELSDPPIERCNGQDDDCDASTFDGSADPDLGARCDGADDDLCAGGVLVCNAGRLACTDPLDDAVERCGDGVDDDCDGRIDEAPAEGARTFYLDADGDGHGDPTLSVQSCERPDGYSELSDDCNDRSPAVSPSQAETCNGRDDDCREGPDDGDACAPCARHLYLGRPYLFCPLEHDWATAAGFCTSFEDGSRSYRLAKIEDSDENAWVSSTGRGLGSLWIGLSQDGSGDWRWVDGTAASYLPWASGEPNDGGSGRIDEDCAELNRFEGAGWNDAECDLPHALVCEWY